MTPAQAVTTAAELIGSKAELARQLGVKPPTVSQWESGERPVPPARAIQIEELTAGQVKRTSLCPGFPWERVA